MRWIKTNNARNFQNSRWLSFSLHEKKSFQEHGQNQPMANFPFVDKYIYQINYGVIKRFPAMRKAATTHVKKYDIFSRVFDIANQLLTRHSPFAPLGQVDEWTAKPSRFSIQGSLSEIPQIMATRTFINPFCSRTLTFNLLLKGKKTNLQKEKPKVTYSMALVIAFLAICHMPILAVYLTNLSVRPSSINKNFVNWKWPPLLLL